MTTTAGGTGTPILGTAGGVGSVLPIAVSGLSRGDLREDIARVFGFLKSTASAGATTTLTDATLTRFPNDYFIGAQVWISEADGAAPEDETSFGTDFVKSTGVLTFAPAMTAAVASGDHYHIYMIVTKDDIDEAIAMASQGADASYVLTVDTTTLDYDLTYVSGLRDARQVRAVWLRSADDTLVQPTRINGWQIEDNFGQLTLRLPYAPNSNDALWIEYQLDETGMTDDAMRCNLPSRLVKARAMVHLLEILMMGQDASGREKYGQMLRYWNDEKTKEDARWQPKPGKVQKYQWNKHMSSSASRADEALNLTDHYQYLP